jgi:hypothetical protein
MSEVKAKVQGAEKFIDPASGWVTLFVALIGFIGGIALPAVMLANEHSDWWGLMFLVPLVSVVFLCGLFVVNPNESTVITFFGKYVGTVV